MHLIVGSAQSGELQRSNYAAGIWERIFGWFRSAPTTTGPRRGRGLPEHRPGVRDDRALRPQPEHGTVVSLPAPQPGDPLYIRAKRALDALMVEGYEPPHSSCCDCRSCGIARDIHVCLHALSESRIRNIGGGIPFLEPDAVRVLRPEGAK